MGNLDKIVQAVPRPADHYGQGPPPGADGLDAADATSQSAPSCCRRAARSGAPGDALLCRTNVEALKLCLGGTHDREKHQSWLRETKMKLSPGPKEEAVSGTQKVPHELSPRETEDTQKLSLEPERD